MKKAPAALVVGLALSAALAGCASDADTASRNLSKEADSFNVQRKIVFYNGITGENLLLIEGRCSIGNEDRAGEVSITCKTGPKTYTKDFLGLSDNVTYFAHQLGGKEVSPYYHRVVLKPQGILPDFDIQGGAELPENQ